MARRRKRLERNASLSLLAGLLGAAIGLSGARAEEPPPAGRGQPDLVNQANAPLSSILQLRVQDSYAPVVRGLNGDSNALTLAVTMPLPEYRYLPFPQLSLLTLPTAVTLPDSSTGTGDLRFVDVAVLGAGHRALWGVGPILVFPTASERSTGQDKWQAGPAVAFAFVPRWGVLGALATNPISFSGASDRADVNALFLQPFLTYQLGAGWFVRSQPLMVFNWERGKQVLPLDLGVGRVFRLGRQSVNCFVEPFWNLSHDGPSSRYGITFGVALLYPDFWNQW